MCRGCSVDNTEKYMEAVHKYHEINNALREYEKLILETGGMSEYHKSIVKLRRKFNKEFNEFEPDKTDYESIKEFIFSKLAKDEITLDRDMDYVEYPYSDGTIYGYSRFRSNIYIKKPNGVIITYSPPKKK